MRVQKKICESFGFNKDLSINMASLRTAVSLWQDASYGEEMTTAIGQGVCLATPQMALVASAVANGGTLMTYYVDEKHSYDGDELENLQTFQPMPPWCLRTRRKPSEII